MRVLATFAAVLLAPTLAAGLTVTEAPPIGDYGDDFASRTVLPDGADLVLGGVTFSIGGGFPPEVNVDVDYIALADLQPGASFTLTLEKLMNQPVSFTVFDSLGGVLIPAFGLPGEQGAVPPTVVSGIVPLDGEIAMRVQPGEGFVAYVIAIDALRVVPEPGAAALLAVGLVTRLRRTRASRR